MIRKFRHTTPAALCTILVLPSLIKAHYLFLTGYTSQILIREIDSIYGNYPDTESISTMKLMITYDKLWELLKTRGISQYSLVNYPDPKGSKLVAGPGSANVVPKHSPSFEIWEYTLMPPHHRVIDETRHKPSVMQKHLFQNLFLRRFYCKGWIIVSCHPQRSKQPDIHSAHTVVVCCKSALVARICMGLVVSVLLENSSAMRASLRRVISVNFYNFTSAS